jgi:phage tail sheath protein FI
VETAIPAFIGYTEKAINRNGDDLAGVPTRITSLLEFEQYFGKAKQESVSITVDQTYDGDILVSEMITPAMIPSNFKMYYALQMFFSNGGGPCYIISVGQYGAATNPATTPEYGNDTTGLKSGLNKLMLEDEPTIIVFPDAINITQYGTLIQDALKQCKELQDRVTLIDVKTDNNNTALQDADTFRNVVSGTIEELKYGAAYYPYLHTILTYAYAEEATEITHNITSITPATNTGTTPTALAAGTMLDSLKTGNNALYGSIKEVIAQKTSVILAPSSAIAGVYASVDNARGVWKAPANVPLNGVVQPTKKINDKDQEPLNVDVTAGKSINAIRAFTGRGNVVWGARTLAGNDNEWRYISVRRFFNFVEESVKKSSARFVFEPNSKNTWVKVKAMIENFLIVQWRAGALVGDKPEQAFYVNVGLNQTMTADDILNGYMVVEIGMAVVRPAEFIILQFSHKMQEA